MYRPKCLGIKKRLSHDVDAMIVHECNPREIRCWNPRAKCEMSGKRLFGRKCVKTLGLPLTFAPIVIDVYYEPRQYVLKTLKQ